MRYKTKANSNYTLSVLASDDTAAAADDTNVNITEPTENEADEADAILRSTENEPNAIITLPGV